MCLLLLLYIVVIQIYILIDMALYENSIFTLIFLDKLHKFETNWLQIFSVSFFGQHKQLIKHTHEAILDVFTVNAIFFYYFFLWW